MTIRDIVREILDEESAASKAAKKAGLVHLGFGRYGPKKGGSATHVSKDGKLKSVGDDTGGGEPEDKPFGGDTGTDADFQRGPSVDPGSMWDKHSTKVRATSPEHQKEIDAWMKKYSNPKGGVDWDQAKKDNAPFPKREPKEKSVSRKGVDKVTSGTKAFSDEDTQETFDNVVNDENQRGRDIIDYANMKAPLSVRQHDNLVNGKRTAQLVKSSDPADKLKLLRVVSNMVKKNEKPKEKRPGGKQAEDNYHKADMMMKKYAGRDIPKAEFWAKKKKQAADAMMGRTGKELGENKMNESIKFHTITGNKRFMTKTALKILRKYGIKNVTVNQVAGDFLEIRFPIDSNKLKKLDKELKRKNKTAYGGIVENRRNKMKITEETLRKAIRAEIKSIVEEEDEKSAFNAPIPAQIERYMKKFIAAVQGARLNRRRIGAILGRVVAAMNIDPSDLMRYVRLVKKGL